MLGFFVYLFVFFPSILIAYLSSLKQPLPRPENNVIIKLGLSDQGEGQEFFC